MTYTFKLHPFDVDMIWDKLNSHSKNELNALMMELSAMQVVVKLEGTHIKYVQVKDEKGAIYA